MGKAKKVKGIRFTLPNKVGLLSEITTAVSAAKVNITAICAYAKEDQASFTLITDGGAKAKKALTALGVEIEEKDVIEVEMPNKPGELQKVAKKIAEAGIDIDYMFGTAKVGKTATCIFKTADDPKAIKVINK